MTDTPTRIEDLREILTERRRELQIDIQERIRDGRAGRSPGVRDELEASDADIQGDIDLALLQMRAETLVRIDAALVRLDAGTFGRCAACEGEISSRRLRALPFALRCQACEERRETRQGDARRMAQRRSGFSLTSVLAGS